jgi:hypothetical protein
LKPPARAPFVGVISPLFFVTGAPGGSSLAGLALARVFGGRVAMPDDFSAELQQFVAQHIQSLLELETLLLLRQDPARTWTPAEVAKTLYTTAEMCSGQLGDLARRGFLELSGGSEESYRYRPVSSELGRLLDELAATYQQRRVAVITFIYSKPVNKVQTFADAFRLRRED